MTHDTLSPARPQPARPAAARVWSPVHVIGFVSVTLFIASEVVTASAACVWALSGLIGLDSTGTAILAMILGLPALLAIGKCAQLAYMTELDPAND